MAIKAVTNYGTSCHALDVACGLGGQAIRLAEAGVQVVATDLADFSADVLERAAAADVADKVSFLVADLRFIDKPLAGHTFDIICCQRAIHYLPWQEAVLAVKSLGMLLKPEGKLFLSASGITSELGDGYAGHDLALAERYVPLADSMATKHNIQGPVCLYSLEDLAALFSAAGLSPTTLFVSEFGNVKGVAAQTA